MTSSNSMKCIGNKVMEIAESKVTGKVDMGVSLAPKNSSSSAKSAALHCKCSVTMWKLLLGAIGVAVAFCLVCMMLKGKKCKDC
ncbi:MAG: hypothetical protein PUB34_05650 [Clostridia bacterium]|nr:hypothetical protein [Clostridia bacterium]